MPIAVKVIQKIVDHAPNRPVRLFRARSLQEIHQAGVLKELIKALNIVSLFQSVQIVHHQAELVIAIFRQRLAAVTCRRIIVEIGTDQRVRGIEQFAAIKNEVRPGKGHNKVGQGLQRDQVKPVLLNQINAVLTQRENQLVSVTRKGSLIDFLQSRRFSCAIECIDFDSVQQRGTAAAFDEQIIVPERVFIKSYLPLLVCSILLYIHLFYGHSRVKRIECRAIALCSAICFLSSFAGYCINAMALSKYYSYILFSPHFIPLDFNRLSNVIVGIFNSLGYRSGDICLQTVTCNVFCAVLLISTLYCMIFSLRKHSVVLFECLFMSCYFCSNIALFVLLFVFTDMAYVDRYNLPILILMPFLLAVYLNQSFSNDKKTIHIHNIRINYVKKLCYFFYY